MADTTAIAIVSISASAVVGLGAPVVAHVFASRRDRAARTHELHKQERELDAERQRADVAELRLLLDEVIQNITQALGAFYVVRSMFIQLGANATEEARGAMDRFRECGRQVDVDRSRVAIRLGAEHPVGTAHAGIAQAIVDTAQHVAVAQSMGEHANLAEAWQVVVRSGEDFYAARDAFTAEAARLVGSRVVGSGGDARSERSQAQNDEESSERSEAQNDEESQPNA